MRLVSTVSTPYDGVGYRHADSPSPLVASFSPIRVVYVDAALLVPIQAVA